MSITLYPHQHKFISDLRTALMSHQSVLAQASCGFGKTVIASYMAKGASDKGKHIMFTVHRKDLILQTARTFDSFGIDYGIIAAGYLSMPKPFVQIASIETLKNRYTKTCKPDLLVVDEAHLSAATGWKKLILYYKALGCKIVGLTATPWRLSGEGLDDLYDTMVQGPKTEWLIKNDYLSDYKVYAPKIPDLSGVHSKMGDYVNTELVKAMNKGTITGDAISHYRALAYGKKALAFCASVEHSKHVANQFNNAGVSAVHIDGETPLYERRQYFEMFANGDIKVITSVAIFCEGFDLSSQVGRDVPIEAVILLRPTQSLTLHVQQTGRALRRKPYPAIILDHSGNTTQRHGLPDEDREWSLSGRERNKSDKSQDTPVRTCPKCFAVMKAAMVRCKYCGHVFEIESREVEEREGELVEIDKEMMRRERMREQGRVNGFEELVALGKQRGYKHAYMWARNVMQARAAKRMKA